MTVALLPKRHCSEFHSKTVTVKATATMAAFAAAAMPNNLSSLEGHSSLQREQIALAFAEGHDADIPSNAGIYHPTAAEQRRLDANSHCNSDKDSIGTDSGQDLETGKSIIRLGDEEKDVVFEAVSYTHLTLPTIYSV